MAYLELPPSPELARDIELLWCLDGHASPHDFERVLPQGVADIVINLGDGEVRCYDRERPILVHRLGPIISGVQRSYFVVDTRQLTSMVGVHFKPGGAWRFLGIPASEFSDEHVPLDAIPALRDTAWLDRLATAPTPATRLRLLDSLLRSGRRRESHPAIEWAVGQLRRYPDSARIAPLATEAGLSMRRFNELFTREVGVSPKGFARIRRFHSVLGRIAHPRPIDWSALALDAGYSDQAHLIRDFREFSGLTPAAYRAQGAPLQPGHVYGA